MYKTITKKLHVLCTTTDLKLKFYAKTRFLKPFTSVLIRYCYKISLTNKEGLKCYKIFCIFSFYVDLKFISFIIKQKLKILNYLCWYTTQNNFTICVNIKLYKFTYNRKKFFQLNQATQKKTLIFIFFINVEHNIIFIII